MKIVMPMIMLLGLHKSSYGRGPVQLKGARVTTVYEIPAGKFYKKTCFTHAAFLELVRLHKHLPMEFRSSLCTSRQKCSREIGLLICVTRWRTKEWEDVEELLHIRSSICSDLYQTVVEVYKDSVYAILARNIDVRRIYPLLDEMMEGFQAAGSVIPGNVAVIDGKPMATCRPSMQAAKKRGFSAKDDVQYHFFNSHYGFHGMKIAHSIWADGIAQVVIGSIKLADQQLMNLSKLDNILESLGDLREDEGKSRPTTYGDPAYILTNAIKRKHKGAISADEAKENVHMIRPRAGAQDTFKDFITLFDLADVGSFLPHAIL